MTLRYSTTLANKFLNEASLKDLIFNAYLYDQAQYRECKNKDGQYSYIEYIKLIRQFIDSLFYKSLPLQNSPISEEFVNISKNRCSATCIILNNSSLLGHVSVLRSMSNALIEASTNRRLIIANLIPSKVNDISWQEAMISAGFFVPKIKRSTLMDRFLLIDDLYRPKQYLWWGWPPGQWLGPLLAPSAVHRSISFKYDFPLSQYFDSHHIGYGEKYVKNIKDQICIKGFEQKFNPDYMNNVSRKKIKNALRLQVLKSASNSLKEKNIVNVGTLARTGKVEQKEFLEVILYLLKADPRIIFHYTGKTSGDNLEKELSRYNLLHRVKYHGWVNPMNYLSGLDLYLDTFPFGTGEALVTAGYVGLPLVIMKSPYEANFSNLLDNYQEANCFVSMSTEDYKINTLKLLNSETIQFPIKTSDFFHKVFDSDYSEDKLTQLKFSAKLKEDFQL